METKKKNVGITVIYTSEQFKDLTVSEIVKYMRENKKVAIVGVVLGIDRHIIRYRKVKDWLNYSNNNPYSED